MKKLWNAEGNFKTLVEIIAETENYIHAAIGNQYDTEITGFNTGYIGLDKMICGLMQGNITLIAARPSMGSTALALNISRNLLSHGKSVAIISLEMSAPEVMLRFSSLQTSIPLQKLRLGELTPEQYQLLKDDLENIQQTYSNLFIDDQSTLNIDQISTKLRQLKSQNPDLAVAVIDILQVISRPGGETVGEISYKLKMLALELDIPIVVLSKLNSALELRTNKRPILSDIPDSDMIEPYADTILFIYRDDFYLYNQEKEREQMALIAGEDFISCYVEKEEEEAEIIIAKQHNGPVGHTKLLFQKKFARFVDHPLFGGIPIAYETARA